MSLLSGYESPDVDEDEIQQDAFGLAGPSRAPRQESIQTAVQAAPDVLKEVKFSSRIMY
jgi:hypothetical protein